MSKLVFTKEMKKDYTILVPTMLPIHFNMIISILKNYGYKVRRKSGRNNERLPRFARADGGDCRRIGRRRI